MVAQRWGADDGESLVLDEGSALWERLNGRIAPHFGRVEVLARLKRSPAGLLARIDRKNGWQIAEVIGEDGPRGVQRLLNAAVWDAEDVRDQLRAYVIEHLGDTASGALGTTAANSLAAPLGVAEGEHRCANGRDGRAGR